MNSDRPTSRCRVEGSFSPTFCCGWEACSCAARLGSYFSTRCCTAAADGADEVASGGAELVAPAAAAGVVCVVPGVGSWPIWPVREVLIKITAANAIRFTLSPRFLKPPMLLFELARSMFVTHDRFHLIGVLRLRMRPGRS